MSGDESAHKRATFVALDARDPLSGVHQHGPMEVPFSATPRRVSSMAAYKKGSMIGAIYR